MPTEPCAVIWDVDGTLVDTAELHFAAWVRLAGEMGRPFSRDDFAATFGRRNPEIIRYLFRHEFTEAEVLDIGERKEIYLPVRGGAGRSTSTWACASCSKASTLAECARRSARAPRAETWT